MKHIQLFLVTSIIFLFLSCGSDATEDIEDLENANSTKEQIQKTNTKNIFYSIPSPVETADIIKATGISYDGTMLNNPDNHSKYISEDSRALNLGVYGADLSYISVFEQAQESMIFLKCVNQMCKSLGISGVFDEKTADRIEQNKDVRDSVLNIISNSFWEADAFLKENQRPQTSTLIVTGGWIEGLYLACHVGNLTKNKKVMDKVAMQKLSLGHLIQLLEGITLGNDAKNILDQLRELSKIYDQVEVKTTSDSGSTNNQTGITTLGGNTTTKIDARMMEEIAKKINEIRNGLIKV